MALHYSGIQHIIWEEKLQYVPPRVASNQMQGHTRKVAAQIPEPCTWRPGLLMVKLGVGTHILWFSSTIKADKQLYSPLMPFIMMPHPATLQSNFRIALLLMSSACHWTRQVWVVQDENELLAAEQKGPSNTTKSRREQQVQICSYKWFKVRSWMDSVQRLK